MSDDQNKQAEDNSLIEHSDSLHIEQTDESTGPVEPLSMTSPAAKPLLDTEAPIYYVGIGASAGGLEALQELFDHLPAFTGAAYIIVQHLSPDFKSMMVCRKMPWPQEWLTSAYHRPKSQTV